MQDLRRKLLVRAGATGLTALSWATCPSRIAMAQDFPSRPLRIVVPFTPGGLTDVIARQAAEGLRIELGQAVVVDNRPGASGQIGAELAARATPDGYTLALLSTLHVGGAVYSPEGLRYDLLRDFVPIGMLGYSPAMLVARADLRIRNVEQMVAHAKAHPGKLSLACVATYIGELLEAAGDIDLNIVLYRGASAATNDLLGGSVDMMSGTASDMASLFRSGRLVPIGVSGTTALPYLPEVRPIVESLPHYRGGQWYALFAPAATPGPAVEHLRRSLGKVVQRSEFRQKMVQALVSEPDLGVDAFAMEIRATFDAFVQARARRAPRQSTTQRG